MTVSNTTVKTNYTVAGGNDTYAIPFDFFTTDDVDVYVDDVLQVEGTSNDYTFTVYTTDSRGNYLPANVVFNAGSQPADATIVTVIRVATIIQEEDFQDGDPVPQEKFEDGLDKLTLRVQETEEKQDRSLVLPGSSTVNSSFPAPGAGEYVKYNAAGTALETGEIDLTSIGADIATNVADIATNTAAISANTSGRITNTADITTNTANILTNTGNISTNTIDIATNVADIATNVADIATNTSDLDALKLIAGVRGNQTILNLQTTYVNITDFLFDADVYDYVTIKYIITRNTDSNFKSETGTLDLTMRGNGIWAFENGLQLFDIAGVTFKVTTGGGNTGQVSYITDNLAGTSYAGKIRYNIEKFEV